MKTHSCQKKQNITDIDALLETVKTTKIKFIQMNRFIRYSFASGLWMWCLLLFLPGTTKAQTTLGFSIEGATVLEKDTFVIAVKADSLLTGRNIYSYRFGIS